MGVCKAGFDCIMYNVVVNFLSQVIYLFIFLFLGMIIYANEVETKEK